MNTNFAFIFFCFSFLPIHAQLDTLLFEDFQTNPFPMMDTSATGSNTNWVNYDADGLETAFQTEDSKQWFWGEFFTDPIDPTTGQTNYVATSLSFLEGSLPGNRNWLVLPPLEITDDNYMLHWKSAPNQMPRYMDGYTVLVSTGGNNLTTDFTETIFTAASMDEIIGNSQSTDYSNFTFTDGYLHADGGMNSDYFVDNGGTILNGVLEPHSVSLEAYVGETIYIAFLHDSDDDERLAVDDILITKLGTVNTNEQAIQELRMECYPNPVDYQMNLNFKVKEKSEVSFQVLNSANQIIQTQYLGELSSGMHYAKLVLNGLPSGTYFLTLQVGNVIGSQALVKR